MVDTKIVVVGLGYIGLPTSLALASAGNSVIGFDLDANRVQKLQHGIVTFEEKGLDDLFKTAVQKGIKFSSTLPSESFYIICVPTPYDKESKRIDPVYVVDAFKEVYQACEPDAVVVIESTISPGTIDRFVRPLISDKKINLVHCPERIIPGNMVFELSHNSRTIGADKPEIAEKVKKVYSTFCKGEIVITNIRTAEMTKVVENTFRDINIACANELVKICDEANLDVYEVIKIANMHPRVHILQPGPGVGGHCISVDPWFLVGDFPMTANLIKAARMENDSMPGYVLKRVSALAKAKGIEPNRIGLYGLTYKQDVDDIRESPTLQLLEIENEHLGPSLPVFDPMVKAKAVPSQIMDFDEFLSKVDLVVVMQNHSHLLENASKLSDKIVFDTKNCLFGDNIYKF
jgi:UDP-N-acetyl-D-mannosaminuronic acid dehydrogenase